MAVERILCPKFSAGSALTTASAAKPERTAEKEKRIVIESGVRELEVKLESAGD